MPPRRTPKTTRKTKAATDADADIDIISAGMARTSVAAPTKWWSATFQCPYKILVHNLEDLTRRQLVLDMLGPNIPEEFIRSARVLPGGKKFELLIGCPRWFFETAYIERRMGEEYHAQHSGVESYHDNVVQPVRRMFPENHPWIDGAPIVIPLPVKCQEGPVNWERSTWRTRGMQPIQEQVQFQLAITFFMFTQEEYVAAHQNRDTANFADLNDNTAL